jgi:hypothetical protein
MSHYVIILLQNIYNYYYPKGKCCQRYKIIEIILIIKHCAKYTIKLLKIMLTFVTFGVLNLLHRRKRGRLLGIIESAVSFLNNILWSYVIIATLITMGVYFTIRTKFVQFRYFGEMFRIIGEPKGNKKGISSLQAFFISTASRVGTGNLAGVALAISVGGPGAVFWMWLIALIGGASSFVESTLAQIYKVRDKESYRGGPAYYMERGLNKRWM